jgi:hypothetical protein
MQQDDKNTLVRTAEGHAITVVEELKAGDTTGRGDSGSEAARIGRGECYVKWQTVEHESGLKQYVVTVGWGSSDACTEASPEQCPYKLRIANFVAL